ncbi:hypothetical protein D3OALGA1CA_1417 [Olavius algarvensis associated proteobacterium Delta 3]|nr:hypothetical protein D3OALGB2SA_865 [Olavius algarvensis associated proteobacterium Delta 3]CAB5100952.1 hypothetical protein D3OALGA1CA_1417 [Olavius algarvensis associated proteobacterium Delta 3]
MKTEISSDEGMKFAYEKLEVWNKAVDFFTSPGDHFTKR